MKPIQKDEMFAHVSQFLKGKGIELKDGSYVEGIQKSCGILTDAVNLSQQGLERAKGEIEKRMNQMRQVIHEKTAPKPPGKSSAGNPKPKNQKTNTRKATSARAKR
jgi:hypothetical protein